MAIRGRGSGEFGFDNGVVLLVLNPVNIQRMYEPGGITYRWMRGIMVEMEITAKGKLVPGHGYVTGRLHDSVAYSITPLPGGLNSHLRATARHAIYYHEGTYPHHIEPVYRKWLKYPGGRHPSKNGFTYAKRVLHPGQRGRPFLRESMQEVLAVHGIASL